MSKFDDILRRHGIIIEQPQAVDVPPGTPGTKTGEEQTAVPDPTQETSVTEPSIDNQKVPESEVKKLSPASFVWLVTVLKNSFLAHPELQDQKAIEDLQGPDGKSIEEINVENAQQVLDSMWPIISKYMPAEAKTSQQSDTGISDLLQKV